jgi:hypothetical protein
MSEAKTLIQRALKNGFDLSTIENYSEKLFKEGLYDYLVENKFYVTEEDGVIFVGIDIFDDAAEIIIEDEKMTIKPLIQEGFFDILMEVFKYFSKYVKNYLPKGEEDIPTESYSEEDSSSEELWL